MEKYIANAGVNRFEGSVSQQFLYFRKAKRNIQSLKEELMFLERKKEVIMKEVEIARNDGETIAPLVLSWLADAEKKKEDAEIFLDHLKEKSFLKNPCSSPTRCYSRFKHNLKLKCAIGNIAAMRASDISMLQMTGEFVLPQKVETFASRMSTETEFMKALLDESISMIGVCGMVGVGKTTTIKTIVNDVFKKKIFGKVVMAAVSQNPNVMEIQDQLASRLGLPLPPEGSVVARAERLNRRFMNKSSTILVILDDIWKELDLSSIGLPDVNWRKGLKVILSSRQLNVCREMEVQKIVQVEPLTEEEAWSLFKKAASIYENTPKEIKEIAMIMANKCDGLPLPIAVMGKALRDKEEVQAWINYLQQLNINQGNFGPLLEVIKSIELSFNSLGFESRSLLTVCSLFPENYEILIEDLARYAKGLNLFKNINSLLQTREKLESIISALIDCFLLKKCGDDRVKLHGTVRISCLSIASAHKVSPATTSHEELIILIQKNANEFCNAMSLGFDEFVLLSSHQLQSSRLQLLRLSSSKQESNISTTDFLQGMEKLEVLDIHSIELQLHPTSLQSLTSLRTLNLNHCRLENDLSVISSMKNIEILSFYGSTYVGKFPNEIGELRHLKSLDLRFLKGPADPLPSGILIHLKRLEELYLGSVICEEIIAEIESLSHLNTIQILLGSGDGLVQLLKSLKVDSLTKFHIFVGPSKDLVPYHFVSTLVVEEVNDPIILESKMKALAKKCVHRLKLRRIKGLTDLVNDCADDVNRFQDLKDMELIECDMKHLGNATDSITLECASFVELEKLYIRRAAKLEELYPGNLPPESFCKLQEVIMSDVPLLSYLWNPNQSPNLSNIRKLVIDGGKIIRSLFFGSLVVCFYQLQFIRIKDCPRLETMISMNDQEERDTLEDIAQFPKLEEVYLDGVLSFHRFYSDLKDNEHSTRILSCVLPELRSMRISGSELLEIVFDFEGLARDAGERIYEKKLFDRLNSLHLSGLPQLRRMWGMLPKGTIAFQNLVTIVVEKCGGLKYLLTPSMAKMLTCLRSLQVISCDQMETIIGNPETNNLDDIQATTSEIVELEEELEENYLCLQHLSRIELFDLPMFRMICSESINLKFPFWKAFGVALCPRMSKICEGTLSAPKLKVVDCLPYGTVSIDTMSDYLQECEYKKRCLNCAIRGFDTCDHLDEEAPSRIRTRFIKARDLRIAWVEDSCFWEWLPADETHKMEIARLKGVHGFDIRAKVDTKFLSKKTLYAAYLVYDLEDKAIGLETAKANVRYSHQITNDDEGFTVFLTKKKSTGSEEPFATTRADGHLEIELGRFKTRDGDSIDGVVEIWLFNTNNHRLKKGIHVLGVEVRPC